MCRPRPPQERSRHGEALNIKAPFGLCESNLELQPRVAGERTGIVAVLGIWMHVIVPSADGADAVVAHRSALNPAMHSKSEIVS